MRFASSRHLLRLALIGGTAACSKDSAPARVHEVQVASSTSTLLVGPGGGQTAQLTATLLDAKGRPLTGRDVAWAVMNPLFASVNAAGIVTALRPGTASIRATSGQASTLFPLEILPVPTASVTIAQEDLELVLTPITSASQLLAVALRDTAENLLTDRTATWTSSDAAVASVTTFGGVSALTAGSTYIRAASGTVADSVLVTVTVSAALPADFDIAITKVELTQGVQSASGTLPLIRGGRRAVVNVLTHSTYAVQREVPFVLRVLSEALELVYADRVGAAVPIGSAPLVNPTVQFLLPRSVLQPGHRWEVVRDGSLWYDDADAANDRFPTGEPAAIASIGVPPIRLRFIPIVLDAHGGVQGDVHPGNVEEYLRIARAIMPVGEIEVVVAPPYATGASFGTAPNGGGPEFWIPLLQQLDALRVADVANQDAYWVGIVLPPPGFTRVLNGGYGYVPSAPSSGPGTRTSVSLSVGWANDPDFATRTYAHELGHNLSRPHSPCGGAPGADSNYPYAGGVIGNTGHDTHSWEIGLAARASGIAPTTGDIMGYCAPSWISDHTWSAIALFRGSSPDALHFSMRPEPALFVQGLVTQGVPSVSGARVQTMRVLAESASDAWTLVARAVDGSELARRRFSLSTLDHTAAILAFGVAIPMSEDIVRHVHSVEIAGPGVSSRFRVQPGG